MVDETVSAQHAEEDAWLAIRREREWEEQHGGERARLTAQVSSSLLAIITGFALALVLLVAGAFAWLTDRQRPMWVFLPMAVLCILVGLSFVRRYVREARALREFDRQYPRDADPYSSADRSRS